MKVLLSFDDGCSLDLQLASLLARYDLKATFYIPVMWESYGTLKGWTPLTKQELLELSEAHEIGSHTISHPLLTQVPYAMATYEITNSKQMLEGVIGKGVDSFSYPRGYATDQLRNVVRKVYKSARSTLVGNTDEPTDPAWHNTTVHIGCQRTEYDKEHWFDYAIRHLEQAEKKDGYFHAWGHSHEIEKNNQWNSVERLFERLAGLQ